MGKGGMMIHPMTEAEIDIFTKRVRKLWGDASLNSLMTAIRMDTRMKQQFEIRIKLLEEIIEKRIGHDSKSKQFAD
jgi:hypothetical protein